MKKNKVLIYTPASSYGHIWLYFKAITDSVRSVYPMDFEVVEQGESGVDREKITKALKEGAKVICVNGAFIEREEEWIRDIIEKYSDSFSFYFKENPLIYGNILGKLPKNARAMVNSREHVDYLKKYYGIKAMFIPNAAIGLKSARKFESRANDILVVGTYLDPESLRTHIIRETPAVLEGVNEAILKHLEKDYKVSAVTCMEEELNKLGKKIDRDTMLEFFDMYLMHFIEYQNRYFRKKIVWDIIKSGKIVSLLGQNWNVFMDEIPENEQFKVSVQGQFISLTQAADMMANVKMALSLETEYKDGIHERVGAGLLAGVNMLTFDTPFARELAKKNPAIKVFNPNGSKDIERVIDKCYENAPKTDELPEELTPEYAVGKILECIYGKNYNKVIASEASGKTVKKKAFEYIAMGDGRFFVKNPKTGLVETGVDVKELVGYSTPYSIFTGVIDGIYNPADALKAFGRSGLYKIYMVSSDYDKTMKMVEEFGISDIVKKRLVIFRTKEDLKAYLTLHDEEFLPRVYGSNKAYYKRMTDEIHKKRISKPRSSKVKPILSIGMPTYNRGEFAIKGAYNLLKTEFDSEVEIMISNNASTNNTEGYEEISKIKDSRLRYWKNPENLGYMGNIFILAKKARGNYICYQSDEDYLYTENFAYYMGKCIADPDIDFIQGNSDGEDNAIFVSGERIYDDKAANIIGALNSNYVTGVFINVKHLRKNHFEEVIERNKDNKYVYYYTHCILMTLAMIKCKAATTPVKIYHANKGEKPKSYAGLIDLNKAETRYSLAEGAIDFVCKELKLDPIDLEAVIRERIKRTFQLIVVGFSNLYEAYLEAGVNIDNEIAKMDDWLEGYLVKLKKYFPESTYRLLCKDLVEDRATFATDFENIRKQVIKQYEEEHK